MPTHTAYSFLSAEPNLQTLLKQAQKLMVLQKAWEDVAPRSLATASKVGSIHQQTLIIYVSNGAVAGKLRQLAPSLLTMIQERGFEVTAIQVNVQLTSPQLGCKPKDLTVSRTALTSLAHLEQSLAGSPLKNALQTLIRRHSDSAKD